jgi:UDP-N-acetylmuramoylalanine--D-glutamate ligase
MDTKSSLQGKKVLLVGLGRLGGGIAAAKYFAAAGAKLTITDQLSESDLKGALGSLKGLDIAYRLGGHAEKDFRGKDMIVFNPAVPITSPWVGVARRHCKRVYNDLSFFLARLAEAQPGARYIALTGTRGKTTTTTWIGHFLRPSVVGGNMPTSGLFKIAAKLPAGRKPIVLELSSFQLEFIEPGMQPPHVALITNLSPDHLNRHGSMEEYIRIKAGIFANQSESDYLILNRDNSYTKKFLAYEPKATLYFVSLKKLPKGANGLYFEGDSIMFRFGANASEVGRMRGLSEHQKYNLLEALLASYLYGKEWGDLMGSAKDLPEIPFRQEKIFSSFSLEIINDSASTSPEGLRAALGRFAKPGAKLALICGGTDKQLEFKDAAKALAASMQERDVYFLEGSATTKLVAQLKKFRYFKKEPQIFGSLEEIMRAIDPARYRCILFSPGAASFEKFKNEFDRGRKFAALAKRHHMRKGR